MLIEDGWNKKPNYKVGAEFLRQSAEEENIHGLNNYGLIFYRGQGVNPDIYGKSNLERLAIVLNNELSTQEGTKHIIDIIRGLVSNYVQQTNEEDDDDVQDPQQHFANLIQNLKNLLSFDPRKK